MSRQLHFQLMRQPAPNDVKSKSIYMRLTFVLIHSLLLLSCNGSENEIFIIPKNYTGYVVVIYNQHLLGADIKYRRGKRVYEIPANGILKTQFLSEYGLNHFPEFYYEKIAPENKIQYRDRDKIPIDTIVACCGATGGINRIREGKAAVEYIRYYVGDNKHMNEAYKAVQKLNIDSLAD